MSAPALRASLSAIALACLGLVTFGPLLEPECSAPRLNSPITLPILFFGFFIFPLPISAANPPVELVTIIPNSPRSWPPLSVEAPASNLARVQRSCKPRLANILLRSRHPAKPQRYRRGQLA